MTNNKRWIRTGPTTCAQALCLLVEHSSTDPRSVYLQTDSAHTPVLVEFATPEKAHKFAALLFEATIPQMDE